MHFGLQLAVFRCQCWLLLLWRRTVSPWVTVLSSVRAACESLTSCCVPQITLSNSCVRLVIPSSFLFLLFIFSSQATALNLRVLQGLSNQINPSVSWAPTLNSFDYLLCSWQEKLIMMYKYSLIKQNIRSY